MELQELVQQRQREQIGQQLGSRELFWLQEGQLELVELPSPVWQGQRGQ